MKILVCGSRNWTDRTAIENELLKLPLGSTIIHGAAKGADRLAGEVAKEVGLQVVEFPPDWNKYGKSAGFKRNLEMLDANPDLVLAFQLDGSKGTQHTIDNARKRGIKVGVFS
jgi:hypothetical protein